MKGKLFLIPTILAEGTEHDVLPASVKESISHIQYFLCENVRTARRFISSLRIHNSIESLQFEVLDKDTKSSELEKLFMPIREGKPIGLLSESGCPGVADPGAMAVEYAHQNQIIVVPMVGPSSILLALMASGLNGQQFAFHGYLPIDSKNAVSTIKELERESKAKNQTQIFIETPYRNNALMAHLLKTLKEDTILVVAIDLTSGNERVIRQEIGKWKKTPLKFEKAPAVFLFLAAS